MKHAHSQQNPERDWGRDTLDAVRLAFHLLNEERGERADRRRPRAVYGPENTIVIASSVSNGGAAAVAAAEQDTENLIDGVAVAEPVLQLGPVPGLTVRRGAVVQGSGRPLYDYVTLANLYQPCAAQAARAAGSFGIPAVLPVPAVAAARCAALRARGLLTTATLAEQADESLDLLIAARASSRSRPRSRPRTSRWRPPAIAIAYANAYGRFGVQDNLCDLSYAGIDPAGAPAPLPPAALAQVFGTGNGMPPTSGIQIINNVSVGGARENTRSVTPSTGVQDYNVDAAVCQRDLWTGTDARATRVRDGVQQVLRTGDLHGKPAIIVAGRADALIPVNFNARPYLGLNKATEGAASKLSYIEVTNAQHFDAFIDNPALRRLRHRVRPAAPLLHPGDGPHVGDADHERAAAALAAGAHHPPRRHTGTGAGDHPGQPAADRLDTRGGGRDHRRRRRCADSGVRNNLINGDLGGVMPWRSFLPTSWFPWPGGASSTLSAPQNLEQPILPGWVFGSVVNVNDQNSAAPDVEAAILRTHSYGRQLGQIVDALQVLIDERKDAGGGQNDLLDKFTEMKQTIDRVKAETATARVEQLRNDLAHLKDRDRAEYDRLRAEVLRALE